MAVGGTRVVGSRMRVGRPAGGSVVAAPAAPPRSGSSRAGWWSAISATTSASPCPSPTRCCWPFAHEGTAAAVEAVYTEAVGAPSAGWSASAPTGMRGHHGDGQSAATVAGSGFLGWSMVHRAARPVAGRPVGDPHWPVHVTLANMTRGADGRWLTVVGRWSTVAADERDLMRPAPAVDKLTQALVRNALHRRYGVSFARNACTGRVGVPAQALRAFAKRGASIEALLADLGFDPGEASRAVQWVAEQRTRGARTEAAAARGGGWDPVAIARRVLAGGGPDDADGPR